MSVVSPGVVLCSHSGVLHLNMDSFLHFIHSNINYYLVVVTHQLVNISKFVYFVDSLIDFNDCSQVELASLANKVGQFLSVMEHFKEAEEVLLEAHHILYEVLNPTFMTYVTSFHSL